MAIDAATKAKLATLLGDLLSGTAKVGLAAMPILKAYGEARMEADWKQQGIIEWLMSDPQSLSALEGVFIRIRDQIPEKHRAMLIVALGGLPT